MLCECCEKNPGIFNVFRKTGKEGFKEYQVCLTCLNRDNDNFTRRLMLTKAIKKAAKSIEAIDKIPMPVLEKMGYIFLALVFSLILILLIFFFGG